MRSLVLVGLALLACRPGPVEKPELRPLPKPADVLRALQEGPSARRAMRTLGRITYFGEKGRVRLGVVVVAERPGRFRVETLSPMEQPIDVMVSDGERIWLLTKGQFHEGPATRENLARLLPLPLRPDELVSAMLGGAPGEGFEATGIALGERDRWLLTVEGPAERAVLTVEPSEMLVERVEMGARLVVEFEDFEPLEGATGRFARSVRLRMPEHDHEVSLKLKEVEVNPPLDPALFGLRPPPGTPVLALDSPPAAAP